MPTPATRTSWWPQQLLLGWLNLALTAPLIYLYIGLPLVMRQNGWSGTQIGLMQLAGLPAMLKFLFATPVDRYRLGQASYRNWTLLLMLCYAAALGLLAAHDLGNTPASRMFLLAMLVSVLGTWADVPLNALAIQILPESERVRAGAIRSAAMSLGAIVGGGVMLLLHTRAGWAWPFYVLALGLLSGVLLLPWLKPQATPCQSLPAPLAPLAGWRQWPGYFAIAEHRTWALLVLVYYPFLGAVWLYLKPLMLDQGFAADRIALIVGIVGGLAGALSSMLAGRLTRRIGASISLPLLALGNLVAIGFLTLVIIAGLGHNALIAAALLVALAMGASAGLMFGLMMYHTRPGLAAVDYGIQSSLFVAARTLVPILAGVLLDRLGYPGMLGCLLVGLVLVLLLAWHSRRRIFSLDRPAQLQGV
jgi:PAT family beta-lactamase induction signal transducer AmpG